MKQMTKRQLENKRKKRFAFAEQCRLQLRDAIGGLPNKELREGTEILVWHEDVREVAERKVAVIELDGEGESASLVFTDKEGHTYDESDIVYADSVYPYLLEMVLGCIERG